MRTPEQEAQFKKWRLTGIGGSDVAAICGLSPYKSIYDVWVEKVGLGTDEEPSAAARLGQLVEPIILDEYEREKGVELVRSGHAEPTRHKARPWQMGTPDALVAGALVGVDAKMAGWRQLSRWGAESTDDVPTEYLVQALWYLDIFGFERWDIEALIDRDFRTYEVRMHERLLDRLVAICEAFWKENVETRTPPSIDHTIAARKMLARVYPAPTKPLRDASADEAELARQYYLSGRMLEMWNETTDRLQNQLSEQIGFANGIKGSGFQFTWLKNRDRRTVDWEAVAKEFLTGLQLLASNSQMTDEERTAFKVGMENVIEAHTETKAGPRVFRKKFDEAWHEKHALPFTQVLPPPAKMLEVMTRDGEPSAEGEGSDRQGDGGATSDGTGQLAAEPGVG